MKQDVSVAGAINNINLNNSYKGKTNNAKTKVVTSEASKPAKASKAASVGSDFEAVIDNVFDKSGNIDGVGAPKVISAEDLYNKENVHEKIQAEIEKINVDLGVVNKRLSYHKHDASGQFYVQVVDSLTDEVIREIPSEDELNMIAKLKELAGLVVDKKI